MHDISPLRKKPYFALFRKGSTDRILLVLVLVLVLALALAIALALVYPTQTINPYAHLYILFDVHE